MAGPWNAGVIWPYSAIPGSYQYHPIIQYATFSMASSATSQVSAIIAASAGYHAVVLSGSLSVSSDASITFRSHTTTTQTTGTWSLTSAASNNNIQIPYTHTGWFTSATGEALDILQIGSQLSGAISFIYI